jgi:hypothetical protein
MALDFPSSPILDQTYSFAGRIWRWNGESWVVVSVGLVGATGPTGATPLIPLATNSITGVASFNNDVFIIGGTGHVRLKTGIVSGSVIVLETSSIFGVGETGALPALDGSKLLEVNAKYLDGKTRQQITDGGIF